MTKKHRQFCYVASLQTFESKWVWPEMDLPKLSIIKLETEVYYDQFYFWACFGGIVLERRARDGTINDFDNKGQSRGDGSTYHNMIQNLEYA